jgi:hypothetical protein
MLNIEKYTTKYFSFVIVLLKTIVKLLRSSVAIGRIYNFFILEAMPEA